MVLPSQVTWMVELYAVSPSTWLEFAATDTDVLPSADQYGELYSHRVRTPFCVTSAITMRDQSGRARAITPPPPVADCWVIRTDTVWLVPTLLATSNAV